MAKVSHVKKAQQRYALVPKLNDDGSPVVTPYLNKDGTPKLTKRGRPVVAKVTVEDKNQPLPMPNCEVCHKPIEVGKPYQHVTPQTSAYGGSKRYRHEDCPTWKPWDLSNSVSARCAQIVYDAEGDEFTSSSDVDDMTATLESAASSIRELAEEKEESANSLEDGFGHETQQVSDLRQLVEDLNGWADEVENAQFPDKPDEVADPGEFEGDPEGEAFDEWREKADAFTEYEAELESWVDEVIAERDNVLGNSPA